MITSVEITNLRGIQQGKLEDLTPLTILVGPNGSGKSTVLEALLISANSNQGEAIINVALRRQGLKNGAQWLFSNKNSCNIAVANDAGTTRRCNIVYQNNVPNSSSINIRCNVTDKRSNTSGRNVNLFDIDFTSNSDFRYSNQKDNHPLESVSVIRLIESASSEKKIPLYQIFTAAIRAGRQQEIRDSMKVVIPQLEDVVILTDGDTPIVDLVFSGYSLPSPLVGDGVQSLLRLVCELASSDGGTVLIEEPEVHQHLMAMGQSAEAIWTAIRRGTQVILSTHSVELIDMLMSEVQSGVELAQMSVYRTSLREGCLRSVRVAGDDIAFQRVQIGDDLR